MSRIMSRTSTYCNHVERHVNYEISLQCTGEQIECSTTCTGIEDKCESCPILQLNNTYPMPSAEHVTLQPLTAGRSEHFRFVFFP